MSNPFPHPLVLGHRGAPLNAPENTLRSFALAMEQGADGVELDVQRAADGVPVVIHDGTLERTTTASGAVADHAWSALQRMTEAQLPSLEQAAAWAASAGAWLNVEIKARDVERATLDVLRRTGGLQRVVISSFHADVVERVGHLAPEVHRFLLTDEWDDEAQRAVAHSGAQGVCLRVDAATDLALEVLRSEALPVIVWTVDSPQRMRQLLLAGVAGLITNRPDLGVAARDEVTGKK